MELYQAEEKVNKLRVCYRSLRASSLNDDGEGTDNYSFKLSNLPDIGVDNELDEVSGQSGVQGGVTVKEMLVQVKSLQASLGELQPKMDKFRQRLSQKDPVTGNPRYGEATAVRVHQLLKQFDEMAQAMSFLDNSDVLETMEQVVSRQEAAQKLAEEEEERRKHERKQILKDEQENQEQRLRQEQAEAEANRQHELLELNRRAEESRQARQLAEQARLDQERRERENRERADREWMAGITKGPEGVKEEMRKLREATQDDCEAQTTALTSLHTLFSQIVSHPEEIIYRRVRRDHPKFNQDIGRHAGGKELLIAAGFRLGAIDDVPCFLSTEPNIETDMDGWSDWFNLLRATLDIIQEEVAK
jgi:hypothetical protein